MERKTRRLIKLDRCLALEWKSSTDFKQDIKYESMSSIGMKTSSSTSPVKHWNENYNEFTLLLMKVILLVLSLYVYPLYRKFIFLQIRFIVHIVIVLVLFTFKPLVFLDTPVTRFLIVLFNLTSRVYLHLYSNYTISSISIFHWTYLS